jgi:hypothetical protein
MKLLQWIITAAALGLGLILLGLAEQRDGLAIGGSIIVGAVVVAIALLGSSRTE